jgi:predicted nucleic acid-binding protein
MPARPIVLDANILVRGVLGAKVPSLLATHSARIDFLTPDVALEEARKHLPAILRARGADDLAATAAIETLDALTGVIRPIPAQSYEAMREAALARIGWRDPGDWPVLACALMFDCPIWTEDRDFFGTGIATWTTALIELFLSASDPQNA